MLARSTPLGWSAVPLGLALVACGGDEKEVMVPTEPTPAAIALVSGDGQEGKAGDSLPEPFVVRVTDADGDPLLGVEVIWRVGSGAGRFRAWPAEGDPILGTHTDHEGLAQAFFWPAALGTHTVVAEVSGLEESPVTFASEATGVVIVLRDLLGGCEPVRFYGPDGGSEVVVPVETPVEWTSAACDAHFASASVPPGGEPFDSGVLSRGERFGFVPAVAGTWVFEDRLTGESGTLTIE